jgi:transposase
MLLQSLNALKVQRRAAVKELSTVTIGCDLGDKWTHVCAIGVDGEVLERRRLASTSGSLTGFFRPRPASRVVMEVGSNSRWISRLVEGLGHEVIVANPRQLRLIYGSHTKNDRSDAELLARLGRYDPMLLSPIRHRSQRSQEILSMIRLRESLVDARTKLINSTRGIVKSHGHRLPSCSSKSFPRRVRDYLPEEVLQLVAPALEAIASLTAQIGEYDRRLELEAQRSFPECEALRQVPGVGPLTALTFVVTLDDPSRFRRSRDVGSYLGLRPRQDQSGATDKQLRITKAGDRYLRKLLVQCAHYILGHFGPDTDLRRWGLKLAERGGGNAKRRAVVAVARKLAVLLHRLWVSGERYVPVGYRQQRLAA